MLLFHKLYCKGYSTLNIRFNLYRPITWSIELKNCEVLVEDELEVPTFVWAHGSDFAYVDHPTTLTACMIQVCAVV